MLRNRYGRLNNSEFITSDFTRDHKAYYWDDLQREKLIRPEGIEGLQALVMNFTLPILLFYTFYRAGIKADTVIFPVTFFVVTAGGIFAGRLLCKLVKEKDVYFPFTLTGYEAGMLGYALFGILLGNDKITQFALMDIGHVLAIFTVYVAMVKSAGGSHQTAGEAIKGILSTPVLIGILLGVILSVTGIGEILSINLFNSTTNSPQ